MDVDIDDSLTLIIQAFLMDWKAVDKVKAAAEGIFER